MFGTKSSMIVSASVIMLAASGVTAVSVGEELMAAQRKQVNHSRDGPVAGQEALYNDGKTN